MTYWKDQERRIKKVLEDRGWKARRQPGSGNLDFEQFKNDVYGTYGDTSISIDHKSTRGKQSISIKLNDLEKCKKDAENNGDDWTLSFSYLGKHTVYAVVELSELLTLMEGREND